MIERAKHLQQRYFFRMTLLVLLLFVLSVGVAYWTMSPADAKKNLWIFAAAATFGLGAVWALVINPVGQLIRVMDEHQRKEKINKQRIEIAMRSVSFGVWDWNLPDDDLFLDGSMLELLGYAGDTAPVSPRETWTKSFLPEDRERVMQELSECLARRGNFHATYRVRTLSGALRTFRCASQGFYDEAGKPLRLVGVTWDITEKVEHEMRALQSSKMSSLGEMSAGLAHEINNPLAIIMGKTDAIRAAARNGAIDQMTLERHVKVIEKTALRIAKIVRGLRTFSRDGEHDPFEPVSVIELVTDTLALCRARFVNNGVDVTVAEIDPTLVLECRGVQVSQVLLNLLNNAHDAVESLQEKWVHVEVVSVGEHVEFRVTDSGRGISRDIRDRIMQPFFTTKEIGRGTGLGLSISLGIAETHAGQLVLDEASANTRFVFALPRLRSRTEAHRGKDGGHEHEFTGLRRNVNSA